jgi:DNA-binding FrmR family transcriptional regulator
MKNNEQRINMVIGQLEAVQRMLNDKTKDCFQVVVQLKAARSALSSLMDKLMAEEFSSCLCQTKKGGPEKMKRIMSELIKNN